MHALPLTSPLLGTSRIWFHHRHGFCVFSPSNCTYCAFSISQSCSWWRAVLYVRNESQARTRLWLGREWKFYQLFGRFCC